MAFLDLLPGKLLAPDEARAEQIDAAREISMFLPEKWPRMHVALLVLEMVEQHWYHDMLHNLRTEILKALLHWRDDNRTFSVSWYLES